MRHGWTLEKQEWDILPRVIEGTNWSKTRLAQLYRDHVPKRSGVYIICVKIPHFNQSPFKSLYNVIYVGKADRGTPIRPFSLSLQQPKTRTCVGETMFR